MMTMKCPTCNGDCVLPAQKVLDDIMEMYMACKVCPPDPMMKKNIPLSDKIDAGSGRCQNCGKRHIDFVMGHVITILKDRDLFPPESVLREVGTPLISFGYQIPYPPRLDAGKLVLIMDSITEEIADEIIEKVPEIKGIIKRKGSQSQSIGILDVNSQPHTYEVISGCDMRCDIVSSIFGELCIYKNQSMIHIEFNNTKIRKMEELYMGGILENSVVVDGFCGPGTLGLLSVMGGAKKVIFNDAWLPALRNTILNIKNNSDILGVNLVFENTEHNELIGDEPVLLARAEGNSELIVYHGDIRKLDMAVNVSDICLLDTFPAINPGIFSAACKNLAKKTFII